MSIAPLESLEVLNNRLKEHFGLFSDGRPNWRIVWSTDQIEKRYTEYTKEGLQLPYPELMEMKKYPFSRDRYILEHLIPVNHSDRPDVKISYEPLWTFETANGQPLAPDWDIIKLLIDKVHINLLAMEKIPNPEKAPFGEGNTPEEIKYRTEQMMEKLFGNETEIGDALAYDNGVGYGPRRRKDWMN